MKLISMVDLHKLYGKLIKKYSSMYEIDEALVAGVIWQESRGDYKAVSRVGAKGLMQLMPMTARDMKVLDVFNPEQNIEGGTRYLAWVKAYLKTDNDIEILAGYNAGIGNVKNERWKKFKETIDYVINVQKYKYEYAKIINKPLKDKLADFIKRQLDRFERGGIK